ncbi:MAG: nucleotidyl transferase AbiEii/AbiGii toxin family protein [Candidatus Diapherotrites archaeon]|nr:nucleotidyl transferase AbiEii/AbiGii toxin family protein [Candidatus Diapherotrites archaeon]
MKIPLYNRLKRQAHKEMAILQDILMDAVYSLEKNAVLHGGTAIWRCFQGNRFSEDLDFYASPKPAFREKMEASLQILGIQFTKFRETSATIYSRASKENTSVELEIALRPFKNPSVSVYEKADGTTMDIYTPSVNELLIEKLNAYKNRRLIRDIYDAYHLSRYCEPNPAYNKTAFSLLENAPKPTDESNLKNLILTGVVPEYPEMIRTLQRRFSP